MTNPSDIPPPLPWDQRAKGAYSMTGGYTGYVDALHQICGHVVDERPSPPSLASWVQKHFSLSKGSANGRVSFLRKTGVLESAADQIRLSEHATRWYVASDDGILIGLLHSRLQYCGEMLAELRDGAQSIEELRQAAKKYGLDWDSHGEVNRRRGWLESAMLVEPVGKGRLAITDAGRNLLSLLTVHQPGLDLGHPGRQSSPVITPAPEANTLPPSAPDIDQPAAASDASRAEVLATEIRDASTDSQNPTRLEFAVRDAFQFLGFDAEKLGGSGKTDVLVRAPLGRDGSYSVTIDAKTVGDGSLGDGQVDWVTLDEHRKQHDANYSMLVGPNPSGKRLMNRAVDQTVAVLSTEQLADLCLQHANAPLGLEDYRALFDTGGSVDTTSISRAAQDLIWLRELAAELLATLANQISETGSLTARDLWLLLRNQPPGKAGSQQEIQSVLGTLANPLVGAIQGNAEAGYVLAAAPRVIQQRLQLLGEQLAQ